MENASKALIIAGAILISILLISVGILIFNSAKGTTDNANSAGDVMGVAQISERAKIILETKGFKEASDFNAYIINQYQNRKLTREEVIELCELVKAWGLKITGSEMHNHYVTHISHSEEHFVYQKDGTKEIIYNKLEKDKSYGMYTNENQPEAKTICIYEYK